MGTPCIYRLVLLSLELYELVLCEHEGYLEGNIKLILETILEGTRYKKSKFLNTKLNPQHTYSQSMAEGRELFCQGMQQNRILHVILFPEEGKNWFPKYCSLK
jgi:hypothetical protein